MNCENCRMNHSGTYGSGRFCSSKCARGFSTKNKREAINKKVSEKLKGRESPIKGEQLIPRENRNCPICKKTFTVKLNSKKVYCSGKCNPDVGGYREGSGRAKTGYYKGIYCGSTYELAWVIFRLDNNLEVSRFNGSIESTKLKYFPDFIENNTIIEIKGYENKKSIQAKCDLAESHGYKIKVLYKQDLKKEFEWVYNHYNFINIWELYDDYRPKYEYNCEHCGKRFSRDKKTKTNIVFCSRTCAGKGHKGRPNKSL